MEPSLRVDGLPSCTWLLMVHDRVGDEQILLTHENMAHHLGGRRAGVSTACNALRDRGIISYRRGRLRIADRELLEQVACDVIGPCGSLINYRTERG